MSARIVDDMIQLAFLVGGLALAVLMYPACERVPEPAVVSVQHNADLSQCRRDSEKYRDAGPDAEMAAYKACADKADNK